MHSVISARCLNDAHFSDQLWILVAIAGYLEHPSGKLAQLPTCKRQGGISMAKPIETEIKLAATPAMLGGLRSHPILAGADQTDKSRSKLLKTADRSLDPVTGAKAWWKAG